MNKGNTMNRKQSMVERVIFREKRENWISFVNVSSEIEGELSKQASDCMTPK